MVSRFENIDNYYSMDMKIDENCKKVTQNVDYFFNMGGMGFIKNNKTDCMISVLINTILLRACVENSVSKYFFSSSACAYNINKQQNVFI